MAIISWNNLGTVKAFKDHNIPLSLRASCHEDQSCGTCGAYESPKTRYKTDGKVVNDGNTMTCAVDSDSAKGKVYLVGTPSNEDSALSNNNLKEEL